MCRSYMYLLHGGLGILEGWIKVLYHPLAERFLLTAHLFLDIIQSSGSYC